MKFMKNVFHLYKADWKRVFRSPLSILLVVALIILPSFYAWFNIKALWDPYSNTSEMPVAVYSADKTETMSVGDKKLSINIGNQVIDNLKKNDQIGWKFVDSKEELIDGVKSGKYYAGIYIPKTFSTNLMSFLKGDIKKPQIDYYVNQKINAIAPKITDKGAGSIQDTITKQFTGTVSDALFSAANKLGIDLDSHVVDITKIKNLLLDTDENLDTIEGYLNQVVALNEKMPEIEEKISKAESAANTAIPQVNALGDKVIALNDQMPTLTEKISPILTLQQKIPQIENAGKQIKMINDDFGQIETTMSNAIDDANKGLTIIKQAQAILPKVDSTLNNANQLVASTKETTSRLQEALPQVASSVNTSLALVKSISSDVSATNQGFEELISKNELTSSDKKNIQNLANSMNQNIASMISLAAAAQKVLEGLPTQNQTTKENIQTLKNIQQVGKDTQKHITTLADSVNNVSTSELKSLLNNVNKLASQVYSLADSIDVNAAASNMNQIASKMQTTLDDASDVISGAQQIDAKGLLTSTESTLEQVIALLKKYNEQLPALKEEVSTANELLNGNMSTIVNAINKGAYFYQNDLPTVQTKLNQAASFIQNDLPEIESKLSSTITLVNEKMPTIKSALNTTSNLIESEWPGLKKGIQTAAAKVRQGENKVDLADIIKLLKNDVKKETNFMESPVVLKQHNEYPIPNYGSASTPFYTALCLWVGGLLMASLLSVTTYVDKKPKRKKGQQDTSESRIENKAVTYTEREKYVAKLCEFMTIGLLQAVIVIAGNLFILHTYSKDAVWFMIFALIIAFSFVSLIFMLVGLLNDFGKGIAVIILVLSISGGGGNFPIQMSGPFFQAINPFLPFTYAVNLLRESVGGIYWPNAIFDLTILLIIGIVSLAIGIWLCPYVKGIMQRINEKIEESHFFAA